MKILLFLLNTFLCIFIKRIPESELSEFIAYSSKMMVSPYKTEETLKSAKLQNYLPIKFKLINSP